MIALIYFFFFFINAISCRYSVEAPCRGTYNEYPQHTFYGELDKIIPELSSNTPP